MSNPNEPGGPTKVKGTQSARQAAEGEEQLIHQQEEQPVTQATPPHGDPLAQPGQGQGQGQGTGEGKP